MRLAGAEFSRAADRAGVARLGILGLAAALQVRAELAAAALQPAGQAAAAWATVGREWAARVAEAWAVAVRVARLWVGQLPTGVPPSEAPVQTVVSGRAELVGLSVRVSPRGQRATPCAEA